MKKTIVFDFDGVIHRYSKGWQDGSIYDRPNDNIKELLRQLYEAEYEIIIVSTRCSQPGGIDAINNWLKQYDLYKYISNVSAYKPPALVYIDDRAIKYDPLCTNILNIIKTYSTYFSNQELYLNANEFELLGLLQVKNKLFNELNKQFNRKLETLDNKQKAVLNLNLLDDWIASLNKYLY